MSESYALYRLPHIVAPGSWHMAADLALLRWVSRGRSRLVFRTYEWDGPTLSLGRTERYPEGWDERALARGGIAVARRPTGGSAVLHVEEVTFALAASIPGPWGLSPRSFANAAAEALSGALLACGLTAARVSESPRAHEGARVPRPGGDRTLCFARSDRGEVEAAGFKVAGLASRFGRAGALCHASVPLTARSRAIAEFRSGASSAREALERNARSVGELLGLGPYAAAGVGGWGGLAEGAGAEAGGIRGLARAVMEGLEAEIASRFGSPLVASAFAEVGIEEEFAAGAATMSLAVAARA